MSAPDRSLVLALRLRDRRRSLGLTQQQVVRRLSNLGITTSNKALSSLEHGAGIDVAKLPEFAVALDCTVTYLLGLTEDPSSWQPDAPFGRRSSAPDRRTSHLHQDLDALEAQIPTTERFVPAERGPDARPVPVKSWILGPYPADGVPGDPSVDPTTH